jgi:hypothetical protein
MDHAVRAYGLAEQAGAAGVKERLGAAKVLQAAESGASLPQVLAALDPDAAPCRPWLHMIATLGSLIQGNLEAASSQIEAAERAGASLPATRCLRALCSTFTGEPQTVEKTELAALPVSPRARAVLGWLIGEGTVKE